MLNERLGDHSIQYFEDKNYKVVKHGWNEKKDEPREEVIGYYNCIYDAVKVIARIRADKKSTLAGWLTEFRATLCEFEKKLGEF